MDIGKRIKRLRVLKGWTQGELARLLNVSQRTMSRIENSNALSAVDKVLDICSVFGITIYSLLSKNDDDFNFDYEKLKKRNLEIATEDMTDDQFNEIIQKRADTIESYDKQNSNEAITLPVVDTAAHAFEGNINFFSESEILMELSMPIAWVAPVSTQSGSYCPAGRRERNKRCSESIRLSPHFLAESKYERILQ
jgi:putative transcriptional regulator